MSQTFDHLLDYTNRYLVRLLTLSAMLLCQPSFLLGQQTLDSAKDSATADASTPTATPWVKIEVPATKVPAELMKFIDEVQNRYPITLEQYTEMQTAIKTASETAIRNMTDRDSPAFAAAELAYLSSAVMLMGNEGPDAQQTTMNKFTEYLRAKPEPSERDLRMILLAGQNLEQLKDLSIAKNAYAMAAEILEKKKGKDFQVWIDMLHANARRIDSLGKPFEFIGKKLDGSEFDLTSTRGKFTLLYVWATWERSTEQELPYIKSMFDAYRNRGFDIVSVSVDQSKDELTKFIDEKKIEWTVLWDADSDAATRLASTYGINAIPTLILLDRTGKVITLEARGLALGKLLNDNIGAVEPSATEQKVQ